MAVWRRFVSYYWTLLKHLGFRVWETRGRELLSALLLAFITFLVSLMFRQVDSLTAFEIGVLALVGWLCVFAFGHVIHAPVLLHDADAHSGARSKHWGFGILGVVILTIVAASVAAIGIWWWISRAPRIVTRGADLGAIGIAELVKENRDLRERLEPLTVKEPEDSLRRRTIRLANEIDHYVEGRWAERPPVNFADFQNPHPTDDQKKSMQLWSKWNQDSYDYFRDHFKAQWVNIVKEYDSKGVPVGHLINDAEQYQPVQLLSFPFPPAREDSMCQFAITRFRELAYHVNPDGSVVDIRPSP